MRIGFVVERRAKDIEVRISMPPNNDQSALVTHARTGDSFALLIGHLYYRDDTLAELTTTSPHDPPGDCQVNDAALVLAAYRQRGIPSLEQLEGDFALIIWDAETRQLIGLRDPLGGYPLFWTQHESTLAFSTSTRPLCALLPQCILNEEYLAEFIMLQAPLNEGSNEQCVYTGIHRVLPGMMVIAREGREGVERHMYWDWLKQSRDPGTNDVKEIAEQYRTLLRTAVQERIRGCTLAHLSGGMDSTSVALLARDVLRSRVDETPLHTASFVYNRLPLLARERPYIESVVGHEPAFVAHQLVADDMLDFDIVTNVPLHDEPYTALSSLSMQQSLATLAAEIGTLTILTGSGADEIHDPPPYYLADLLRQHHIRQAWQDVTKWAQAKNCSPWRILSMFGFSPIIARWVAGTRWAGLLTSKDMDWDIPPWIIPDFAHRHALRSRAIENAQQIYQQCQQTSLSVTVSAIMSRTGDMSRWSLAAPLGIAQTHPFLDPRLLTFGLGMQTRILPDPEHMKPVLAAAMDGMLPDMILNRRQKGHFNEVYYLGLARNLHKLVTLIRLAPIEGVIDKELLIQHLQEGSLAGVPVRQMQHLNYMLSLLMWLSMQQEWQHIHEKVTVSYRIDW